MWVAADHPVSGEEPGASGKDHFALVRTVGVVTLNIAGCV